jgi:hypothetical protein
MPHLCLLHCPELPLTSLVCSSWQVVHAASTVSSCSCCGPLLPLLILSTSGNMTSSSDCVWNMQTLRRNLKQHSRTASMILTGHLLLKQRTHQCSNQPQQQERTCHASQSHPSLHTAAGATVSTDIMLNHINHISHLCRSTSPASWYALTPGFCCNAAASEANTSIAPLILWWNSTIVFTTVQQQQQHSHHNSQAATSAAAMG